MVLDDDMYINSTNGELVHPCHVQGYDLDGDDTSSSSTEENGAQEEEKKEMDEDCDGFVPLGQQGKSTWEVLQASENGTSCYETAM